jgi:hypothetical protein
MKKLVAVFLAIVALLVSATPVFADDYSGWDTIRPLLKDGSGDEFIKPIPGLAPNAFYGETELAAVQSVVDWIAGKYQYVADQGEVWTSSDQMYGRLAGDCEDWAILTTALLRFHTQYGAGQAVTPDKVWVAINLVTEPGVGVVAAHAWVGYKLDAGGKIHIEPGLTDLYRGKPNGMLNFNDAWVKGGGPYLAGP